jgi:hypothetical protein
MILYLLIQLCTATAIQLPPTFTTSLHPGGDLLTFPEFCVIVRGSSSEPPTLPFPCRPALFGSPSSLLDGMDVVWYHNNGCNNDTKPSCSDVDNALSANNHKCLDDYTNTIVLISRGKCPFVNKVFNAQAQNASGVIIVDHPTKKKDRSKLSGRGASADSALIKMWAEHSDVLMADSIHIPIVSIRNEYSTQIQNQKVRFNWTSKCRAHLAYISGMDRITRYSDDWNQTEDQSSQARVLFKSLGLSSTILNSFEDGEKYFRKAIAAYPLKSPKAVPVIHQLGVMLLNHTDDVIKWNESLKYLPGSKPYLCILSEVLIHRAKSGRIPFFLTRDILYLQASQLLSKAYSIRGGVYTPRVAMNQAIILKETFADNMFVREKILEALDDAAAYGDEYVSTISMKMLINHDKVWYLHTPIWIERKRVARMWWQWIKDTTLWPIRSLIETHETPTAVAEEAPMKRKISGKDLEDYQGYRL